MDDFLGPELESADEGFVESVEELLDSTMDSEDRSDDLPRLKRRPIHVLDSLIDFHDPTSYREPDEMHAEPFVKEESTCKHPGTIKGMCVRCGKKIDDDQFGVAFEYIHEGLRLSKDEISRLRDEETKSSLSKKKLYLVLDLDHTLLHSSLLGTIAQGEEESFLDIFRLDLIPPRLTKLRPFVQTFLREASELFHMYICTMASPLYATRIVNFLDPQRLYFGSRVICAGHYTGKHQKGLDLVLGNESSVLILDDSEWVWEKHKENLILAKPYMFFPSGGSGSSFQSLYERKTDENEVDGALVRILEVLKQIHIMFFDPTRCQDIADRDVRVMLRTIRMQILNGCRLVFYFGKKSAKAGAEAEAEAYIHWKMAEELGAKCTKHTILSVTHVIVMSTCISDKECCWATRRKIFIVNPGWLDATNYKWKRQREELFPVSRIEKTIDA